MEKVLDLVAGVLGVSVDMESSVENTDEWDSFNHVVIMLELKSELGLEAEQEEFSELISIKKIIEKLNGVA